MNENKEVEFVDGLFVKAPNEKAPDFVKCTISIKRKDLGNWLRGKDDEWINLQVKESREGKWYAQVDNWKPEPKQEQQKRDAPEEAFVDDIDLPF